MEKRWGWLKNATFPCVAGALCLLIEILILSVSDFTVGIIVSFLLSAGTAAALLVADRRHDCCSVLIATMCGVMILAAVLDMFFDIRSSLEGHTIVLLAVQWVAPVIVCSSVYLVDRGRKVFRFRHFFKTAGTILFGIYLLVLIDLLLFGPVFRGSMIQDLNLIPFRTIALYLTSGGLSVYDRLLNLGGNVIVFIPLGFYLSLFLRRSPLWGRILLLIAVPLGFETLQYLFRSGTADIDDVILNLIGGVLGMLLFSLCRRIRLSKHQGRMGDHDNSGKRTDGGAENNKRGGGAE